MKFKACELQESGAYKTYVSISRRSVTQKFAQTPGAIIKDEVQGLRTPRMRSLLAVNEHFEEKHNAEVRLYNHSISNSRPSYSL